MSAPIEEPRAPRAVVWMGALVLLALIGSAVYLILVRGDALLLDLSAVRNWLCF